MLMKYLRDIKGGPMTKLWSHLLKVTMFLIMFVTSIYLQTCVMHQVLQTPSDYWREDNLDTCLLDTIGKLIQGLQEDNIPDVFFPQVLLILTS